MPAARSARASESGVAAARGEASQRYLCVKAAGSQIVSHLPGDKKVKGDGCGAKWAGRRRGTQPLAPSQPGPTRCPAGRSSASATPKCDTFCASVAAGSAAAGGAGFHKQGSEASCRESHLVKRAGTELRAPSGRHRASHSEIQLFARKKQQAKHVLLCERQKKLSCVAPNFFRAARGQSDANFEKLSFLRSITFWSNSPKSERNFERNLRGVEPNFETKFAVIQNETPNNLNSSVLVTGEGKFVPREYKI